MTTSELRSSRSLLESVLVPGAVSGFQCPACKREPVSILQRSVTPGAGTGDGHGWWSWKCDRCNRYGGIIEAIQLSRGITYHKAKIVVQDMLGLKLDRDDSPAARLIRGAETIVLAWHDALVSDLSLLESCRIPYERVIQHRIGYARGHVHKGTWMVDGLVLPVYLRGELAAVKLLVHRHCWPVAPNRPRRYEYWILGAGSGVPGVDTWYPGGTQFKPERKTMLDALIRGGSAPTRHK